MYIGYCSRCDELATHVEQGIDNGGNVYYPFCEGHTGYKGRFQPVNDENSRVYHKHMRTRGENLYPEEHDIDEPVSDTFCFSLAPASSVPRDRILPVPITVVGDQWNEFVLTDEHRLAYTMLQLQMTGIPFILP